MMFSDPQRTHVTWFFSQNDVIDCPHFYLVICRSLSHLKYRPSYNFSGKMCLTGENRWWNIKYLNGDSGKRGGIKIAPIYPFTINLSIIAAERSNTHLNLCWGCAFWAREWFIRMGHAAQTAAGESPCRYPLIKPFPFCYRNETRTGRPDGRHQENCQ